MFRATLRLADLEASIATEGQQIPIIVRPTVDGEAYPIISGFRRATAMRQLGMAEAPEEQPQAPRHSS